MFILGEWMGDAHDWVPLKYSITISSAYTPASSSGKGAKKFTLSFSGTSLKAYITFAYIPYPDHKNKIFSTVEDFEGKTFKVRGAFVPHLTTNKNLVFQINPIDSNYLICTTPYAE